MISFVYLSPCKSYFLLLCRYTGFGIPVPHRPVEDLAYGVAKFIQKGGSFVNYYMVSNFDPFCLTEAYEVTKIFSLKL
jgi:hypothetical protein